MLKIIEKPVLPKEIFAVSVKPALLAQAVQVFLNNQRQGNQSSLTRADINRTRKKIFKQKGTGHARHGDRKSPIFVGGGVAFAPKPRDYSESFPAKMKIKAKMGALSEAVKENKLVVASGLDKLSGKTKELADFLVATDGKVRNWLLIADELRDNVVRAGRNIEGLELTSTGLLSTYQIVRAEKVLLMEEAIENLGTGLKVRKPEASKEEPKAKVAIKKKIVAKKLK